MFCYRCGGLMLGRRARLANGYLVHFACAVELTGAAIKTVVHTMITGKP